MEGLFEDGTDGAVACVGGQDEGKTRHREAEKVASESDLFALSKAAACKDVQVRVLGFPVRAV